MSMSSRGETGWDTRTEGLRGTLMSMTPNFFDTAQSTYCVTPSTYEPLGSVRGSAEMLSVVTSHLPPKRCRVPASCSGGQAVLGPQACRN